MNDCPKEAVPVRKRKSVWKTVFKATLILAILAILAGGALLWAVFDRSSWPSDYAFDRPVSNAEAGEMAALWLDVQKKSEISLNVLEINRLGDYLLHDGKLQRVKLDSFKRKSGYLLDRASVFFDARRVEDEFHFAFYGQTRFGWHYRFRFVFEIGHDDKGELDFKRFYVGSLPVFGINGRGFFWKFCRMLGPNGKAIRKQVAKIDDAEASGQQNADCVLKIKLK